MGSFQEFIARRLWPAEVPGGTLQRKLLIIARYAYALVREIASGELSLRAMSLVYTTMLSIVPVLGFAFALAKGLGYHRQLEEPLRRALEPLGGQAEFIADNVIDFADRIDGAFLGVLSVGLFLITVLSMAKKTESSFNFVWRVDRPRNFARRFSEYLSVILIGPLVLVSILALITLSSDAVTGLLPTDTTGNPLLAFASGLLGYVGNLLPFVMTVGVFAFLYMFIPNTRVRLVPALAGAFAAGVTWAASGFLFTTLVVASANLKSIYSGFAIVLLAMLWLYLSWLILLLGSQLAYYLQNPYHLRFGQRTDSMDNDARERLSLAIMCLIASDYAHPSHGWTDESLAAALSVSRPALEPIMQTLRDSGLIITSVDERLVPGRDPHHIRLSAILASVRGPGRAWPSQRHSWHERVDAIADRIDSAIESEMGTRTLGQLVDEEHQATAN